MHSFFNVFHVLFCVILVIAVLLQPGSKGGSLGAAFGGGGANTAFGAQGAAPFLSKLTYVMAGLFFITSVTIEIVIINEHKSSLDLSPISAPASTPKPAAGIAPAAPAPVPAQAPVKK